MTSTFSINQWAAWAPGLADQSAWRRWLAAPCAIDGDETPALTEMPAMMRRRVERLGRAALQVAYQALAGDDACPTVFASRYGDLRRSIELMKQLARDGAVSPTAFSMSVHNAFAALFSIARSDRSNYSSVAAGAETAEHAMVEAVGLLHEGASEVLVVYFDEPLPEPLHKASPPGEFIRAWACRIGRADRGLGFKLDVANDDAATQTALPSDLALLRFLIGDVASHVRDIDGRRWHWSAA